MKRTLIFIAGAVLAISGCSTTNEPATTTTDTSTPDSAAAVEDPTNKRGALEAELGEPISVPEVIDITDTALDSDGCEANADSPSVMKMALTASVQIYDVTQIEWLWPSDFYYVDGAGKVTRNVDTSDANPCRGGSKVIDLPPNSAADARVTLDIPVESVAIGYTISSSANNQRVEWKLPEGTLTAAATPTS
ncbi:hypothetical protein CH249_00340 [Rhodococcus sp. 05-2255-3B1]|uniref:hypothetical protein n=1 Tax=Rhodococcus sp. 05-2255-3B1 TaxID=2022482 RepID=UPI000B9AD9D3|nr:hypothetical protein [Rhodococcus sp. 05-2255-3B1]OZE16549.1 hypothetical protein CH249_00340 [Rhodococcus sp. 05-2255-3B1]